MPSWKPTRMTIRETAMWAGESWGKGCRRSRDPWGLAEMWVEHGPTGVSGHNEGEPRTETHLRRVWSSCPVMKIPGKGGRRWGSCCLRSPQPSVPGAQGGGQPPQSPWRAGVTAQRGTDS